MQFLGRLLDTVSSVSTLFSNPYRVRDVPLADYGGGAKVVLREEGRLVLYRNSQCQSWDCVLTCPETPSVALRSVLIPGPGLFIRHSPAWIFNHKDLVPVVAGLQLDSAKQLVN